jgi:hypothetical protein
MFAFFLHPHPSLIDTKAARHQYCNINLHIKIWTFIVRLQSQLRFFDSNSKSLLYLTTLWLLHHTCGQLA